MIDWGSQVDYLLSIMSICYFTDSLAILAQCDSWAIIQVSKIATYISFHNCTKNFFPQGKAIPHPPHSVWLAQLIPCGSVTLLHPYTAACWAISGISTLDDHRYSIRGHLKRINIGASNLPDTLVYLHLLW